MDKQKILNQIRDGHKFIEMLIQAFPKSRNQANNIGWVLNAIKDEINKPDVVVTDNPVEEKKDEKK